MFVGRIARFPVKCLSSQTETWPEIGNSKEGSHFLFRHSLIINWVNSILSITFSRLQLAAQKLLVWMYYILEVHHVTQPTLPFHSLGDLSTSTLIIKSALSICYFSLDSWNERSNKRNGKVIPHVITSLHSSLSYENLEPEIQLSVRIPTKKLAMTSPCHHEYTSTHH